MRKGIVFLAVAGALFACATLHAQDERHMFTDNLVNGYYLAEKTPAEADAFVQGVIDGVGKMTPGTLSTVYPDMSRGDVVESVKKYYRDNPDKITRPVSEVLLSGCE